MKLHQLLAIERDVRKRCGSAMTQAHRYSSEDKFLQGVVKLYEPIDEAGHRYPDEKSPVQTTVAIQTRAFRAAWAEECNAVALKDDANTRALADVIVDGEVVIGSVPATHLLYLEKHLEHVRTFVSKLVTLPPGITWTDSAELGCYESDRRESQRTEKLQKPITLAEATKEHPAQAQLITQDVPVGHWSTTYLHGGIPEQRKATLLRRIDKLRDAVKLAREHANSVDVGERHVRGEQLMLFVFGAEV